MIYRLCSKQVPPGLDENQNHLLRTCLGSILCNTNSQLGNVNKAVLHLSNADKAAQTTAASSLPRTDQNHPCLAPPQSSHDTQVLPGEGHKVTDKIQKMTRTFPAAQPGDQQSHPSCTRLGSTSGAPCNPAEQDHLSHHILCFPAPLQLPRHITPNTFMDIYTQRLSP